MSLLLPRDTAPPPGERPFVSVAVPVLNGGDLLVQLATALAAQEVPEGGMEVLFADSGSDDGSLDQVRELLPHARLFDVAPGAFDHGSVRTALARQAQAPLVAFFSQDAVPVGSGTLTTMAAALADPEVAGVYARQVPRPGANRLVTARLARWTPPGSRVVQTALPEGTSWSSLAPQERMRLARFDNVASMVRRSELEARPFRPSEFGEDISWGASSLQAGRKLAYVPTAQVEHHHELGLVATYRRHRAAHRQASREFGVRTVPNLLALSGALVTGFPQDIEDAGPLGALRGFPLRAAALAGQWGGGRAGAIE